MNVVRLLICDNVVEASLIKGRLENEGIYCFIINENFSTLMPHYSRMLGAGIQIMVSDKDYEQAIEVLQLNKKQENVCPNCGSNNVKIGLGRNKFKKIIAIVISVLSSIPFNNINSSFQCKDCKSEFK
jgi:DNA-directed RNA polymerase subunit RPC12/RpoP